MQMFSLPRPVAFVLGGGGSLGAVQVGMLQALAELEVSPDLVAVSYTHLTLPTILRV